jgi:hypothetical protein
MAPTRLSKHEDLIAFLADAKIPHQPAGDDAVEVRAPNGDSILVRWERGLPYLQVIYPFIGGVPPERDREVMSAVCRVNNTIKLPGFGYEPDQRMIYMRLCVQLDEAGSIGTTAFQRQVLAVVQNATELVGGFRDVVAGAPGKDVIELALEHQKPASG